MNIVRQKWAVLKAYRRVQRLWEDYKAVSDKSDVEVTRHKLTLFLDSFQQAHEELDLDRVGVSLDKVYGDLTEVLVGLLKVIDRETSEGFRETQSMSKEALASLTVLINKALTVAEMILKDEKYRTIVAKTPNLINTALTLLEKLDSKEAKKLALRVISAIGESNENKIEIGRHQGFKKILKLLFEEDEELTQEIIKTLKHIMTVRQQQGKERDPNSRQPQNNFFGMSEKVSTLFSDVGRLVASELFRYFSAGAEGQGRFKNVVDLSSLSSSRFIPSAEEVNSFLESFDKKGTSTPDSEENPPASAAEGEQPASEKEETDEMLKELMRVQGALSSLTKVLSEATLTSLDQFDIVETICKLLYKNQKNQEAFIQMDGYSIMQKMFDKITTGPEKNEFLENCFQAFFILILDGHKDQRITNADVLRLVVRIAVSSSHLIVRQYALGCLRDLLAANHLNAAILHKTAVLEDLVAVLAIGARGTPADLLPSLGLIVDDPQDFVAAVSVSEPKKEQKGKGKQKEKEESTPTSQTSSEEKVEAPEEERAMALQRYLKGIMEILNYVAVVLSNCNFAVLEEYTTILEDLNLPSENTIITGIMLSVAKIATDFRCRGIFAGSQLIESYVKMLQKLTESQMLIEEDRGLEMNNGPRRKRTDSLLSKTSFETLQNQRKQDLLLLEIVFLLHDAKEPNFQVFEKNGGFRVLLQLATTNCTGLSWEIPDMCLWILREMVIASENTIHHLQWLLCLLDARHRVYTHTEKKHSMSRSSSGASLTDGVPLELALSPLSPELTRKLCQLLVDILNTTPHPVQLKNTFRELGGMLVLIEFIKTTQSQELAILALTALHASFSGSEENKVYLANELGYRDLLTVIHSVLPLPDLLSNMIMVDLAIVGSLPVAFGETEVEPFTVPSSLTAYIYDVLVPSPLFLEPLQSSLKRKTSFKVTPEQHSDSSEDLTHSRGSSFSRTAVYSNSRGMSRSESRSSLASKTGAYAGHSRQGSVSALAVDTQSIAESDGELTPVSFSGLPKLKGKTSLPHSESSSSLSAPVTPVMQSYLTQASASGWLFLTDLTDLVGLVFRDHTAAAALLQYHSYLAPSIRTTFLQLFLLMLEANPQNKKFLTRTDVTKPLWAMTLSSPNSDLEKLYLELMATMFSYDIQEDQARQILEIAFNPADSIQKLRRTKENPIPAFILDPPQGELPEEEIFMDPSLESVRLLALTLIRRISKNSGPQSFFSLNGARSFISCTLDKFPASKVGYTLFCWFNITAFLEKDTGLFSLEDSTGAVIFELYFKAFGNSSKQCLCARTHNRPSPPEDFVFDTDVIAPGTWHMIAFTHKKQQASMFLDGVLLQTAASFNYPKANNKDKGFLGFFGRKKKNVAIPASIMERQPEDDTSNISIATSNVPCGFLCGNVSRMHLFEGTWDQSTCEKVFLSGISNQKGLKSLGVENREFFIVDPLDYTQDRRESHGAANPIPTPEKETTTSDSFFWSSAVVEMAQLEECEVHNVRTFRDVIRELGGASLVLPFFQFEGAIVFEALQTLVYLLNTSVKNRRDFSEKKGCLALYHLLTKNQIEIDAEVFNIVLEGLSEGLMRSNHRVIRNTEFLTLLIDLLVVCQTESVQKHVLRALVNMMDLPENLQTFREAFGIDVVFELVHSLNEKLLPLSFRILDRLMDKISSEELERIFNFIAFEKRQFLDMKYELFEIILKHVMHNPGFVESLKNVGGVSLLISLLDLPSEKIRVVIFKIIGMLLTLNPSQSRLTMAKIVGYDAMWLYLAPFPLTPDLCEAIIGLGIGLYRCDHQSKKVKVEGEASPAAPKTPEVPTPSPSHDSQKQAEELLFPDTIYLLLNLLKNSEDPDLMFRALTGFKRVLTARNMEILWDTPWLEWIGMFLRERGNSSDKKAFHQAYSVLDAIIQKMGVFDLSRKTSNVLKTKGCLVEEEQVMVHFVEVVLEHFLEHPVLPAATAFDTLKNLFILLKYLEKEVLPSFRVCQLLVDSMNELVYHNSPEIRSYVKTAGLLDMREDMITQFLEGDNFSFEERAHFVKTFSFNLVADQAKFRESNGILYLLRMLHSSTHDRQFQITLAEILRNQFAPIEENKRAIAKILDDPQILSRLFAVDDLSNVITKSASTHSLEGPEVTPPPSPKLPIMADQGQPPLTTSSNMEAFLTWYYSTDPDIVLKRTAIEQRIEKLVFPLANLSMKSREKVMGRRNKRLKSVRDKQLRSSVGLNKGLTETKSKSSTRLQKFSTSYQQLQDGLKAARQERLRVGEESWRKLFSLVQEKFPSQVPS